MHHLPALIGEDVRLGHADGATTRGFAPCGTGIVDPQRDDFHAVAVAADVLRNRVAAAQRRGEHEPDFSLLQNVGGAIALAGLRSRIGHQRHAECGSIEVGGLAGIADVKLDVVGTFQRQKVLAGGDRFGVAANQAVREQSARWRSCGYLLCRDTGGAKGGNSRLTDKIGRADGTENGISGKKERQNLMTLSIIGRQPKDFWLMAHTRPSQQNRSGCDWKILEALQQNARVSFAELGRRSGFRLQPWPNAFTALKRPASLPAITLPWIARNSACPFACWCGSPFRAANCRSAGRFLR